MIHKMARFRVRDDVLPEAVDAIGSFVQEVRSHEPGTLEYRSLQSVDEPAVFLHYMVFADAKAEAHHRATAWVQAFVDRLYPLCEEEPVFVEYRHVSG